MPWVVDRGGGDRELNFPLSLPFNLSSRDNFVRCRLFALFSIAKYCATLSNFSLFLPLPTPAFPWGGDRGRETGRKGGGRCTGGGRRGGGKRDSQGGGKREKEGRITQHCAIFRNRKNAKGRAPKNTGRELGLKGTGSGRFKPPCPLPPPPPLFPPVPFTSCHRLSRVPPPPSSSISENCACQLGTGLSRVLGGGDSLTMVILPPRKRAI